MVRSRLVYGGLRNLATSEAVCLHQHVRGGGGREQQTEVAAGEYSTASPGNTTVDTPFLYPFAASVWRVLCTGRKKSEGISRVNL